MLYNSFASFFPFSNFIIQPYLFNLWTTSLYHVTILASAWSMSRRLLCIGYGRHLLLFHIAKEDLEICFQQQNQHQEQPSNQSTPCRGRDPLYLVKSQFVSQPSPILGYITGMSRFKKN